MRNRHRRNLKTRYFSFEALEERLVLSATFLDADLTYDEWREQTFSLDAISVSDAELIGLDQPELIEGPSTFLASTGDLIGLDDVRANYSYTGQGYAVAVIDTGIDYNHPALGGGWGARVIAGYDFVDDDFDPMDEEGHGTHVAGIIGSSDATHRGLAPNVNLIALRVLDETGNGSFGDVEEALRWVAQHRDDFNIVAVNMSLGAGNFSSNPYNFLEDELQTLVDQGVFIAVASGNSFYSNDSQPGLGYPSISDRTVSVGAVWDADVGSVSWGDGARDFSTAPDRITSFTQRSSGLDILAPGAFVTSTFLGGGFATLAGTSMATPVVAGAATILYEALNAIGQTQLANQNSILDIMRNTGVALVDGDDENDNVVNTGLSFPRLDLFGALSSIVSSANPSPVLAPIANQVISHTQDILAVSLSASDPNGDPITLAARLADPNIPATLSLNGSTLSVNPSDGFVGNFSVVVTASDGNTEASQTFFVSVLNAAPVLTAIPDQTISVHVATLNLPFSASDADGDPLSLSAQVSSEAYYYDQLLGLRFDGSYYENFYGAGEKWIQSSAGQWYLLMPSGNLVRWSGQSSATGEIVASLSPNLYENPSLLHDAQPVTIPATASIVGNNVQLSFSDRFVGTFLVALHANDGFAITSETAKITVADTAPVLTAIADRIHSPASGSLVIDILAADADGDQLSYSYQVFSEAYKLDQQYGLNFAGSYYQNYGGTGEKWVLSQSGSWYFIKPDGTLMRWDGQANAATGQVVANLSTVYYADPSLLFNAQPGTSDASISLIGNRLTLNTVPGFEGTLFFDVTVTDGHTAVTDSFQVLVRNHAPDLDGVGDQLISHNDASASLALVARDADGDEISFSGHAVSLAYAFDQQLGLSFTGDYFFNYGGASEKWLLASTGEWHFIKPNGDLVRWDGRPNAATGALVGKLDASIYADPLLLANAQPGQVPVTVSFEDHVVTVTPAQGFMGGFAALVTVTDGVETDREFIRFEVVDRSPSLEGIQDVILPVGQPVASVSLPATDADGDVLTYSARAETIEFGLDQQLGLAFTGDYFFNYGGASEKWLLGSGAQWHFIKPNGELVRWDGRANAATGETVAQLTPAFYADPSLLYNAQPGQAPASVSVSDQMLNIAPNAGFVGSFAVVLSAADAVNTTVKTIIVTVSAQTSGSALFAASLEGTNLPTSDAGSESSTSEANLLGLLDGYVPADHTGSVLSASNSATTGAFTAEVSREQDFESSAASSVAAEVADRLFDAVGSDASEEYDLAELLTADSNEELIDLIFERC